MERMRDLRGLLPKSIPGLIAPEREVTIKVMGKSSWDKEAISKLFLYLYHGPRPSPLSTPHVSKRIRTVPFYKRTINIPSGFEFTVEDAWAEYIYWPTLKLSFSSYTYVGEMLRRYKLASALKDYYFNDLRGAGVTDSYAVAGSPEGLGFLISKGYRPVMDLPPLVRWPAPQPWLHKEIR